MLTDIVIDTNIFLHAENQQEQRQASCQMLIELLNDGESKLCVDEGFDLEESKNRSIIGREYIAHLRDGSLGYALVGYLARTGRVAMLPRKVPQAAKRHILQQIPDGPDRTFVFIAHNSDEKVLVSHDFNDIPPTVRQRIKNAIDVCIVDASQAAVSMRDA
ncbi:hypothetical protein [Acidipila rosea]|uniref:PIN domain-containing protein n=1 Tax=Acidipila rosea TaxID=768535 RepID=A0A4R1KVR6_9BACT|nr:hypothetical protein [Acidipila rosea]TCK68479.1 hypothetical protein C7378_3558 [Acidipila rosea]